MGGLTHCKRCDARFNPEAEWVYGWQPQNDTSGAFRVTGHSRKGDCPICRKPPLKDAA